MKKLLTLFAMVLGTIAFAGDIVWLKLAPEFTYKDYDVACSSHSAMFDPLFLVSEIESGKVVRSTLRKKDVYGGAKKIDLNAAEIATIKPFVSKKGDFWVQSIHLSTRLLNWLFFNADDYLGSCRPPSALATLSPITQLYDFDITPLEKDKPVIPSQLFKYKGTTVKGGSYEISLRFDQSQHDYPYNSQE